MGIKLTMKNIALLDFIEKNTVSQPDNTNSDYDSDDDFAVTVDNDINQITNIILKSGYIDDNVD
tara:strand:+ start:547 stop:738 length:192 start_codon:yes stop_codon:yes gene_type:complete